MNLHKCNYFAGRCDLTTKLLLTIKKNPVKHLNSTKIGFSSIRRRKDTKHWARDMGVNLHPN